MEDLLWVRAEPVDLKAGTIKVRNLYAFKNLSDLDAGATVTADGKELLKIDLGKVDLAPGGEKVITVDKLKGLSLPAGTAAYFRMNFNLRDKTVWAPAGTEMAAAQFPLESPKAEAAAVTKATLDVVENAASFSVKGQGFGMTFDKAQGTFSELVGSDGKNLLVANGGPKLHLWRAPHRTDDMWAADSWFRVGLDKLERKSTVNMVRVDDGTVRFEVVTSLLGTGRFSATHSANYTVYGDGLIAVDNAVTCEGRRIPLARVGVRMQLAKELANVEYFGRGPFENYADRKRGSDVGLYQTTVEKMLTPYEKPMEAGNHEDVSWAALSGSTNGLLVMGEDKPLQMAAVPWTDEVMTPIEYRIDLPKSESTVLTVSAKTLGVGSAGCGPRPLPQYVVWSDEPTTFSYLLRVLPTSGADLVGASHERLSPRGGRVKPTPVIEKKPDTITHGKVLAADSYEPGEGELNHLVDGNLGTFWHSKWSGGELPPPHWIIVDYGHSLKLAGMNYIAREEGNEGHVRDYEIYTAETLSDPTGKTDADWGKPVAKGSLPRDEPEVAIKFPAMSARYVKFVVLSEQRKRKVASIAELEPIEVK